MPEPRAGAPPSRLPPPPHQPLSQTSVGAHRPRGAMGSWDSSEEEGESEADWGYAPGRVRPPGHDVLDGSCAWEVKLVLDDLREGAALSRC